MILAIDPGNEASAFVLLNDTTEEIVSFGKVANECVYDKIVEMKKIAEKCFIEQISNYGNQSGRTILDTCVWIGIFSECFGRKNVIHVMRKTIVAYHTGTARGNDKDVRNVLIERFGILGKRSQKGTKLEGITKDVWQALALAIFASDKMHNREFHGKSNFIQEDQLI